MSKKQRKKEEVEETENETEDWSRFGNYQSEPCDDNERVGSVEREISVALRDANKRFSEITEFKTTELMSMSLYNAFCPPVAIAVDFYNKNKKFLKGKHRTETMELIQLAYKSAGAQLQQKRFLGFLRRYGRNNNNDLF